MSKSGDQWIIQQLSISVEAIRQGTYMRPLTDKENIILNMNDLAHAYKSKYGYDEFVLTIVDTALNYCPNDIQILMLKANCLLSFGETELKKDNKDEDFIMSSYSKYKECVSKINSLGYSEMPKEQYEEWVKSVEKEAKRVQKQE